MKLIFAFVILVITLDWTTGWHRFRQRHLRHRTKIFSDSQELWFTQYLDHFNPADIRVWQQRYFVNDEYYKPNGPVFLYFGGESPADGYDIESGQLLDEAKRFGAKMFMLEHRFYGSSQPTLDLSVESLAYLNAEQALLDAAYFIKGMNKFLELSKDTKWIVFGCSYPGSLAAWMRAKYPHLVRGAVSVSAPMVAKVDFPEYQSIIEKSLKTHSQACVNVLSNATKDMVTMLHRRNGRKRLKKLFKLCNPIDKKTTIKDVMTLHAHIAGIIARIVQSNSDDESVSKLNIKSVCDILVDDEKKPIDRLAKVSNIMLEGYEEKCLDYKYDNFVEGYKFGSVPEDDNYYEYSERQWFYQMCTEFGWFATSRGAPTLYGNRFALDYLIQECADVFEPQFDRFVHSGVKRTNIMFGGLELEKVVSNVVFVHGIMDPWHPVGITQSNNSKAPAIVIKGSSHCADIDTPDDSSKRTSEVVQARNRISRLIQQWLDD